ncbi:MAG: DUF1572 family protein [Acidobacteriota bacterium]
MTVETEFLTFSAGKLMQLMDRIDTCVQKLTPEQIWMRSGTNQNTVGNLMLHLDGNVRQWILHGVGGQADLRDRDSEFAAQDGAGADKLRGSLRATVEEAGALLQALPAGRLMEHTQNQGCDCTVLAAIYHVVEHFAGHTFQIIYANKFATGEDLGFYAHLSGAQPPDDLP